MSELDKYDKIDKEKFFKEFKEKYGGAYIHEVAVPHKQFTFFSSDVITQENLLNITEKKIRPYRNNIVSFDKETMAIMTDKEKVISISIENNPINEEEYKKALQILENNIQTQIHFDIQGSVLGTNLSVDIAKELQKSFPNSLLFYRSGHCLYNEEISLIKVDKIMKDPKISKYLEE